MILKTEDVVATIEDLSACCLKRGERMQVMMKWLETEDLKEDFFEDHPEARKWCGEEELRRVDNGGRNV